MHPVWSIFMLWFFPAEFSFSEGVFIFQWNKLIVLWYIEFLWHHYPVRFSFCEAKFMFGCLPLRVPSFEVIIKCGQRPVRLSSFRCHLPDDFLGSCLLVRLRLWSKIQKTLFTNLFAILGRLENVFFNVHIFAWTLHYNLLFWNNISLN